MMLKKVSILLILTLAFTAESLSQWENLGNPGGSFKTSIAVIDNFIFVATNSNGIVLSTDNGNTWKLKNKGLKTDEIRSLAANEKYIIAGAEGSVETGGVYISTDKRENWTQKNNGLPLTIIWNLSINEDTILAVANQGIFISTDAGEQWNKKSKGIT